MKAPNSKQFADDVKSNQQQQIHTKSPPGFLANMLPWFPSPLFQYLVTPEKYIFIKQSYDRQSDLIHIIL